MMRRWNNLAYQSMLMLAFFMLNDKAAGIPAALKKSIAELLNSGYEISGVGAGCCRNSQPSAHRQRQLLL